MKVNPDDFTEKAWQVIVEAKDIALSEYHQTLETEHLLYSLLTNNEIAIKTIERSQGSLKNLLIQTEQFIKTQPKMQKPQGSVFFGKNIS